MAWRTGEPPVMHHHTPLPVHNGTIQSIGVWVTIMHRWCIANPHFDPKTVKEWSDDPKATDIRTGIFKEQAA